MMMFYQLHKITFLAAYKRRTLNFIHPFMMIRVLLNG